MIKQASEFSHTCEVPFQLYHPTTFKLEMDVLLFLFV